MAKNLPPQFNFSEVLILPTQKRVPSSPKKEPPIDTSEKQKINIVKSKQPTQAEYKEQMDRLQAYANQVMKTYYSSHASVERVAARSFMDLLSTKIFIRKKRQGMPFSGN